jgi:hypothetical protein
MPKLSNTKSSKTAATPSKPVKATPPVPPAPAAPAKAFPSVSRCFGGDCCAPVYFSKQENEEFIRSLFASDADDESSTVSSSTSSSSSFNVRSKMMIYFDHAHGEYHDRITIKPVMTLDDDNEDDENVDFCKFMVTYDYDRYPDGSSASQNELFLTAAEVHDYLNRILRMVAHDDEPFAKIEFDIPMFPNIVYKPQKFAKKYYRKLVLTAADDFLRDCLNGEYPCDILDLYGDIFEEDAVYDSDDSLSAE